MARRSAIGVFNGNWKHKWRRQLEDTSDRRVFIIQTNQEKLGDALSVLKAADPLGWEVWYDDDANIPEFILWTDSKSIGDLCYRMLERAKLMKGKNAKDHSTLPKLRVN